jgi:hypothetical protein
MTYILDTAGKTLLALYQNLLTEMTGQCSAGLGVDDIRYRIEEYVAGSPTPPAILLFLQEANTDVSVTFYRQLDAIASNTGNLHIVIYCAVGGAIGKRLRELDPELSTTPGQQLTIHPPTLETYTDLTNLVLQQDVAPDYSLSDEAAARCAAYALEHLYVSDDIENLLRVAHGIVKISDPQSTCIDVAHINAAYGRTRFDHLNVLKSPPENISFVQVYAAFFLETPDAKERVPFYVSVGDIYARFKMALADQPLPPLVSPSVRFERILGHLIEIGAFFYDDARQLRISIKPEWCSKDNFETISCWDNHPAPAPVPPAPDLEAVINKLYIGHIAALDAIIETCERKRADLSVDAPGCPTISDVYPTYVEACSELGLTPVGRRRGFHHVLTTLEEKHLVRIHRRRRMVYLEPLRPQTWADIHARILRFGTAPVPPTQSDAPTTSRQSTRPAPAQQLALAAIQQTLEKTAKSHALLSEIYQTYVTLCEERGETPAKKQRFKRILDVFESRGLIEKTACRVGRRPGSLIHLLGHSAPGNATQRTG